MKGDFYKIIGLKIRNIRKRKEIKQYELAEMLSISNNYMGRIERGQAHSSLDLLFRIANKLRVRPYELFLFPDTEDSGRIEIILEWNSLISNLSIEEIKSMIGINKVIFKNLIKEEKV